jgi:hypothetical protein
MTITTGFRGQKMIQVIREKMVVGTKKSQPLNGGIRLNIWDKMSPELIGVFPRNQGNRSRREHDLTARGDIYARKPVSDR